MKGADRILPTLVAAAIALIAVTNFCIIYIAARPGASAGDVVTSYWPISIPSSVAVILVMSTLYRSFIASICELEKQQKKAIVGLQRDSLTGAASRDVFEDRLRQTIQRSTRHGELFSVVMLDLDHFKKVNDLHGHQVGDEVLIQAAARLELTLRDTDTLARFGGDEFLILSTNLTSANDASRLCQRILETMRDPYFVDGRELRLPASMGCALWDEMLRSSSDYIRVADMALYEAKAEGRDCFRFYSKELDQRLRRRELLEAELRAALTSDLGLHVCYQPQISASGLLVGVEALLRWSHPTLGAIPTTEAIEIAEESDLIVSLGEFVFSEALKFALAHPELSMAVNLSPAQFLRAKNLPARLARQARNCGVRPGQIEFEITEKLFLEVGAESEREVGALRNHGFRIALDDFGTGYSSLSYLRRVKMDKLKIDRRLVETGRIEEDVQVIRAVATFAHLLGLEVVVEGIETEEHEAVALEGGCDVLQGFHYSAALPLNAFALQPPRSEPVERLRVCS